MNPKLLCPVAILLSACVIYSATVNAAIPEGELRLREIYSGIADGDSIRTKVYRIMVKDDFGETRSYARQMRTLGEQYGDTETIAFADALMGVSYIYSRDADAALANLTEAIRLSEESGFDWGLAVAYNGMGLYALNFEDLDYYQAIRHFRTGLEAAKRGGITQSYSVILANIANTYYLTGNDEGLPYALECYELGLRTGTDYLTFIGAQVSGLIYFMDGDYDSALKFVEESERIVSKEGDSPSPFKAILAYTLHGRILTATGDYAEAKRYFDAALSFEGETLGDELVMTRMGYGDYFKQTGEYSRALDMYIDGIGLSEEHDNRVYHTLFYQKISETYEALGNWREAMRYHKQFSELARKQFDIEKERSINELKVQYDFEKKEAELAHHQSLLVHQKRITRTLWLVVALVALGLAGTVYYYRRRGRLYLEIVRQNQKAMRVAERLHLERQESESLHRYGDTKKYATSSLSSQRSREMFDRLEGLMANEKIYCDSDLNVDKLAETIGSNRTYLSRIINEYSGQNFNKYVNKYRIDEAIRQISDTGNDIPLKALASQLGFNNLTTFYNSFQRETGMPPSQYRKKILEIDRQGLSL